MQPEIAVQEPRHGRGTGQLLRTAPLRAIDVVMRDPVSSVASCHVTLIALLVRPIAVMPATTLGACLSSYGRTSDWTTYDAAVQLGPVGRSSMSSLVRPKVIAAGN